MKSLLQFIPINDVAAFLVGKAWRVDDPRILAALTDSLRSRDNIDDMGRFFAFNVRRADPTVVAKVKKSVAPFNAVVKKWDYKMKRTAQEVAPPDLRIEIDSDRVSRAVNE